MSDDDLAERVQRGYDALSYRYRADDAEEGGYGVWLAQLRKRLPQGAPVLDIGCGCGIPIARSLAGAGHDVRGVDISAVQVQRARRLVPSATFLHADAEKLRFAPESFGAVICLYSVIHMSLEVQPRLLRDVGRWLRPGGWLLATVGQRAWTGSELNWLGGTTEMWWSQSDAASYRAWIEAAGLDIIDQEFVPEGDGGHALFWAQRPCGGRSQLPTRHLLSFAENQHSGRPLRRFQSWG